MADEDESASSLRQKLSESHAKQVEFAQRAALAELKLDGKVHITEEDLKGTKPDEMFERAKSLNEQAEQAGRDALASMLEAQGVDDVDAAVAAVLEGGPAPGAKQQLDTDAINRARQVGATGGPVRSTDISHLGDDGGAQMRHYFAEQERKK